MSKQSDKEESEANKKSIISRVSSYIIGDRSKVMYISVNDDAIISFPWLFPVLFLLVFDVPSWIIALLLICLIVFNLDLNVASRTKRDMFEDATVKADIYNSEKKHKNVTVKTDGDGFSQIVVH